MILEAYMPAFARASVRASRSGGWCALDLFAGGGLNYSLARGREIRGSPLIMLEAGPPASPRVFLCEEHRGAREALESRIYPYGDRARIFPGDANEVIHQMLD